MSTPVVSSSSIVNQLTIVQRIALALRASLHVLLYGPPGTGKSFLARQALIAATAVEPAAIILPEDCAVAELRGHYLPTGDKWSWHDGPVTRSIRMGTPVILDEVSHVSPEGATFLHSCLDRTPFLELPSGDVVAKSPSFLAVATMNDLPERLRPALLDRFGVVIHVERPSDDAFAAMMFGELAKKDRSSSLRSWANLEQAVNAGIELEQAVELIFPGRGQDLIDAIAVSSLKK
jgi:MoxR-like ATPase